MVMFSTYRWRKQILEGGSRERLHTFVARMALDLVMGRAIIEAVSQNGLT